MTQAQAGMQECLVVFAHRVEVLHESPKARAIEVLERSPNVAPGWRGIFATGHGHEPFNDGFMSFLDRSRYTTSEKGQIGRVNDAGRQAPLIWSSARLAASAARANRRAPSQAPSGTPDVNRDSQANCPTIAMNAGEF